MCKEIIAGWKIFKLNTVAIKQSNKLRLWPVALILLVSAILLGLRVYLDKWIAPYINPGKIFLYLGDSFWFRVSEILILYAELIVATLFFVYLMHYFAKRYNGKGSYMHLLKAYGYGRIFTWLLIISLLPYIGYLFIIYSLVMSYFIVKIVHKLKKFDAILTIIFAAVMFLLIFTGYLAVGGMYRGFII